MLVHLKEIKAPEIRIKPYFGLAVYIPAQH